jgi:hypothetical protein
MSKLKNERAEVKAEGASKKIQKRFAPAVRRWNQKMVAFHIQKDIVGPSLPVIKF